MSEERRYSRGFKMSFLALALIDSAAGSIVYLKLMTRHNRGERVFDGPLIQNYLLWTTGNLWIFGLLISVILIVVQFAKHEQIDHDRLHLMLWISVVANLFTVVAPVAIPAIIFLRRNRENNR